MSAPTSPKVVPKSRQVGPYPVVTSGSLFFTVARAERFFVFLCQNKSIPKKFLNLIDKPIRWIGIPFEDTLPLGGIVRTRRRRQPNAFTRRIWQAICKRGSFRRIGPPCLLRYPTFRQSLCARCHRILCLQTPFCPPINLHHDKHDTNMAMPTPYPHNTRTMSLVQMV